MSQTVLPSALGPPVDSPGSPGAIGNRKADKPVRPPRPLGPRAVLPGGRAILGGLLVTLAAVGTFAAYATATSGPTHHFVVAKDAVHAGQRLTAEDLRTVSVDLPDDLAAQAFASPSELEGAIALTALDGDDLVHRSAVQRPARGEAPDLFLHEFSFAVEREHALNGDLKRGERIDLVATYGTGAEAYTTFVARRVQVIDADAGSKSTLGSAGRITITIALDDEAQVLEATHALEIAKVTVVRSTRADPDAPPGPDRFPAEGPRSATSPTKPASPKPPPSSTSTTKSPAPSDGTPTEGNKP